MHMTTRANLRGQFRQIRKELSESARSIANLSICEHLTTQSQIHAGQTIAAYFAVAEEVDLTPWMTTHLAQGGRLLLPRINADPGLMTFHRYVIGEPLETNRFGIQEPAATREVSIEDIDVILAPLLAYDQNGTRLGMGGGYYDRYLAQRFPQIYSIGIAFACQQSQVLLPKADWDVPLHAVVTENGMLEFGATSIAP